MVDLLGHVKKDTGDTEVRDCMQITENAKKIIQRTLRQGEYNALKLITRACPCCGRSFECVPVLASRRTLREETEEVNGIYVVMDATTRRQSLYVTLDEWEGELLIRDETPGMRVHKYQPTIISVVWK